MNYARFCKLTVAQGSTIEPCTLHSEGMARWTGEECYQTRTRSGSLGKRGRVLRWQGQNANAGRHSRLGTHLHMEGQGIEKLSLA